MPVLVSHFYFTNSLLTARLQCEALLIHLYMTNLCCKEMNKKDTCIMIIEMVAYSFYLTDKMRIQIDQEILA